MLLDGGPTSGGIESTVLDLTTMPPRLLRPGLIGIAELEEEIGPLSRVRSLPVAAQDDSQPLRSPGMMPRHYAPHTPLECVETDGEAERLASLLHEKRRVGWVTFDGSGIMPPGVVVRVMSSDAVGYAAQLYAVLHELDLAGLDRILVALPPDTNEWLAVRDRLRRAAHS